MGQPVDSCGPGTIANWWRTEAVTKCVPAGAVLTGTRFRTGTFFRIGAPPCQIEIFPEIPGVQFEACWPNRLEVPLDSESVLSANFISAKIASGREQDILDVKTLRTAAPEDI